MSPPAAMSCTIFISSTWGTSFYGATYPDIQIDNQTLTSYIELDNDYDFYPYNEFEGDPRDFDRRLDAVRVTVAHEFQHSIHFTMDFGEFEGTLSNPRLYWWEMSRGLDGKRPCMTISTIITGIFPHI